MFINRLDDFINTSDKKDIISHCQTRNAISSKLLGIGRNRVTSHFEIEKRASKKNRIAGRSEIEEKATRKKEVFKYSKREDINRDISKTSFLN